MKRTYPAGWILLALITALIATWVPFLVLAAVGFLILCGMNVFKHITTSPDAAINARIWRAVEVALNAAKASKE